MTKILKLTYFGAKKNAEFSQRSSFLFRAINFTVDFRSTKEFLRRILAGTGRLLPGHEATRFYFLWRLGVCQYFSA
jgi:hypothetical protein